MTMLVDEQVAEFHHAIGVVDRQTPGAPAPARVVLRAKLVLEEVLELCAALFGANPALADVRAEVDRLVAGEPLPATEISLPAVADALADLDYVVAGTRLEFGISGAQVAIVVHQTNMAKVAGGLRREDGKVLKPAGWQPPDVAGVLRRQGWSG